MTNPHKLNYGEPGKHYQVWGRSVKNFESLADALDFINQGKSTVDGKKMHKPRSKDPKRNAGISLNQGEINSLDEYMRAANLESTSSVVSLLITKGLPQLWYELELKKK